MNKKHIKYTIKIKCSSTVALVLIAVSAFTAAVLIIVL